MLTDDEVFDSEQDSLANIKKAIHSLKKEIKLLLDLIPAMPTTDAEKTKFIAKEREACDSALTALDGAVRLHLQQIGFGEAEKNELATELQKSSDVIRDLRERHKTLYAQYMELSQLITAREQDIEESTRQNTLLQAGLGRVTDLFKSIKSDMFSSLGLMATTDGVAAKLAATEFQAEVEHSLRAQVIESERESQRLRTRVAQLEEANSILAAELIEANKKLKKSKTRPVASERSKHQKRSSSGASNLFSVSHPGMPISPYLNSAQIPFDESPSPSTNNSRLDNSVVESGHEATVCIINNS